MLSNDEKFARLKLLRSIGVGLTTFYTILKKYGCAEKAIKSSLFKNDAKIELASDELISAEIQNMKAINARFAFFEDELYPPLLRNITDPPPVLSFVGNKEKIIKYYNQNMLAVVGARNASIHAIKFCENLMKDLSANDVVIVSGLARGVDTAAHWAGLDGGTIAVLACGINIPYPQENTKLYNAIVKHGGIFTEMPFDAHPNPNMFPRRNRIIAGMTSGTIVIEAAEKSGSLITARMAVEYNRDVFAVPGSPLDPRSIGGNNLIKNGAILVQNVDDVLQYLENKAIIKNSLFEEQNNAIYTIQNNESVSQEKILNALSSAPITIDELIYYVKLSPHEVLSVLLELELANKIVRLQGQRVCLVLN